MRSRAKVLSVMLLALLASGCASMREEMARTRIQEERVLTHLYARPLPSVWPHVRQVLFSEGYEARSGGEFILETAWRQVPEGERRYLVQGLAVSPETCRVHFNSQTRRAPGEYSDRERVPYNQPLIKAWANARRRVFEEGYTVAQADDRAATLESQWRRGADGVESRVLLQGLVLSEKQSVVHFTYQRRSTEAQISGARDSRMEWLLLQRADPAGAEALVAAAAQQARSSIYGQ